MAMFGPAAQAAFQERQNFMAVGSRPTQLQGLTYGNWAQFLDVFRRATPIARPSISVMQALTNNLGQMKADRAAIEAMGPGWNSRSPSTVIQAGQTQVIRPSQQQQPRAQAPQAGASSSLITSTPSPAEVALATTSLLGG